MSDVKTMTNIQFPNTQEPYQVQDVRIPVNPGAYQQLVTDDNGNWVAEDRLAYKTEQETKRLASELLPEGVPVVPATSDDNGKVLGVEDGAYALIPLKESQTEEWIFTLEDGSTVTKNVVVNA